MKNKRILGEEIVRSYELYDHEYIIDCATWNPLGYCNSSMLGGKQ